MPSSEPNDIDSYLSVLNEQQLAAVTHEGKSLLILAGAGSGKTRVITTKIAYLISQKNVNPYSILSVTFTKKAANEMRERAVAIEPRAENAQIRTFHSFGAWFLRKYAEEAGVVPSFTVYDDDDMAILVNDIDESLTKKEAQIIAREISLAKDYGLLPTDDLTFIGSQFDLNKYYKDYEKRLRATGNVDFGDLVLLPVRVMELYKSVADEIHNRFKVIMVDEYQDSNIAQYKFLQAISGVNEGNDSYVCVVGDDDQSIYHFRGAEVQNILSFSEKFPGTDIIRLEQNYRSTAKILEAASLVVSKNKGRLGKKLIAARGEGSTPVLAFIPPQPFGTREYKNQEAIFCKDLITKSIEKGAKYSDWAILYRTNAQSLGFEKELRHEKIPYILVGTFKFYEREEIKDTLAYLAFCANPKDGVAFRRIVNKPVRGIGKKSQDKILNYAIENNLSLVGCLKELLPEFTKKTKEGIEAFLKLYEKFIVFLETENETTNFAVESAHLNEISSEVSDKRLSDFIKLVVMDSGLYDYHKSGDKIEGTQKEYNLLEIVNEGINYDCSLKGLTDFLDAINLDRSLELQNEEKANDAVTLITLHNTKGLEYNRVIITGLEEGVFPRGDKAGADLEEERRLFYVGITRARNELYVTSAAQRVMYGALQFMRPSPFLNEAASAFKIIGNKPYGFGSHGGSGFGGGSSRFGAYGGYGGSFGAASSADKWGSKSEIAEKWKKGVKVFHDDYGYGVISYCELANEEYKITVTFENGGKKAFLPEYQSHSLLIVKD